MKALSPGSKNPLSAFFMLVLLTISINGLAEPTGKERNILANEARKVDLAKVLITGNSWNTFPDYKNRQFWQNLPSNIRQEYITKAESYLVYNWPVVKATDYLEFIRSGDRKQEVYAACRNALTSLVMGELVEGKGRFMDQIINAVWYYSEQTWWGWNAKSVTPKVEFIEVTDRSLRRYWPQGVTRVVLEFINPGLRGNRTVTFLPN